jgi:hypothetical protein
MVDKVADKDNLDYLVSIVDNILNITEELPPNKEYHRTGIIRGPQILDMEILRSITIYLKK